MPNQDLSESVLIVSAEDQILRDVSHSLNVIGVPFRSASDVFTACALIRELRPSLVLSSIPLTGDPQGGVVLCTVLRESFGEDRPPVVALVTAEERVALGSDSEVFVGELLLPIVFPTFSQKIRRIMNQILAVG